MEVESKRDREEINKVTWYTSPGFFLDNVCISIKCQWPRQKQQYYVVHWTQMDESFVIGYAYRLLTSPIYCGWQWPSMDRGDNILWLALVIDGHASRGLMSATISIDRFSPLSIVADIIHRFVPRPLSPTISTDRFVSRPLSLTISIDGDLPQSIAADNIYQ